MQLPFSDGDRRRLAAILLKDDEELTAERLEGAVRALRRIHLRRQLDDVQHELKPQAARIRSRCTRSCRRKSASSTLLSDPEPGRRSTSAQRRPA